MTKKRLENYLKKLDIKNVDFSLAFINKIQQKHLATFTFKIDISKKECRTLFNFGKK